MPSDTRMARITYYVVIPRGGDEGKTEEETAVMMAEAIEHFGVRVIDRHDFEGEADRIADNPLKIAAIGRMVDVGGGGDLALAWAREDEEREDTESEEDTDDGD